MQAQVFKIHSDFYWVQAELNGTETIFECKIRANLKKQNVEIFVGDFVEIDEINMLSKQATISKLLNRKNFMPRPKVANIDLLIIVSAVKEPDLDFEQLDRYISLAFYYNIKPILCFNKEDLAENYDILEKTFNIYEPLGLEIYYTSAKDKTGLEDIEELINGKLCAFAGASGVGKTSIIKAISDIELKTGEVSEKTKRGTHTTRHCEIINIKNKNISARLLDTPGFSHLNFDFLLPKKVENLFPEIKKYSKNCKYKDCLHISEAGCDVIENLDDINISRYESYCKFVLEAQNFKEKIKNEGYKKETNVKKSGHKDITKISIRKRQNARVNQKKAIKNYEEEDE